MFPDLNFEMTADDIVEFLAFMGGEMDRTILLRLFVFITNPIRLCNFFTETSRQVNDSDTVFINGRLPFTAPSHNVGIQFCAAAFQEVGQLQIKG